MQTIDEALAKLQKSKFRSSFHLDAKDIAYIEKKGMPTIREHAKAFVKTRLAPSFPTKDGKQTPMRGHPVFKAQHATACCCRGCLFQWYHVQKGVALTESQQEKIVNLLMAWIEAEFQNAKQ